MDVLMELFLREATDRTGIDDRLFKIDALLDWTTFSSILKRGPWSVRTGPLWLRAACFVQVPVGRPVAWPV